MLFRSITAVHSYLKLYFIPNNTHPLLVKNTVLSKYNIYFSENAPAMHYAENAITCTNYRLNANSNMLIMECTNSTIESINIQQINGVAFCGKPRKKYAVLKI